MFPDSEIIINTSEQIINEWHSREDNIGSFNEALEMIINHENNDVMYHIKILSLINTYLWHEEDKARDLNATDTDIAEVKRNIDKLNAMRVIKTEEIDNILFEKSTFNNNAPLNTETVASVIDRLTILALKKHHMEYESNRKDSTDNIRNKCINNLAVIKKQMIDLMQAYNTLIYEIENGKRRYALYRQFKMYNDPDLNPVLYAAKHNQK